MARLMMSSNLSASLTKMLPFVVLSQICPRPAVASASTVEFLPSFHGRLPFQLETGSQRTILKMILSSFGKLGGPGCSGFAWDLSMKQVSSIVFVDLPIGTGFTYTKEKAAVGQSEWTLIHHAHQFLRKGGARDWQRCNCNIPFKFEINSSVPFHADLSAKGYPSSTYRAQDICMAPEFKPEECLAMFKIWISNENLQQH